MQPNTALTEEPQNFAALTDREAVWPARKPEKPQPESGCGERRGRKRKRRRRRRRKSVAFLLRLRTEDALDGLTAADDE
ncbi:hypothetical protein OsI_21997 [Oryza sativa Indica Group]|uniref:Uncharacterized protein n=1 Tax=Oryza sativa subsp. indica TaxID=39946 RepID=A2YA84_ORYSI|nr:hypothetical protein OsI_21997 [Oryza sativa Indica Group]